MIDITELLFSPFMSNGLCVGDDVRIVSMDGCMATERNVKYTGKILRFENQKVYGMGDTIYRMAVIQDTTGEIHILPSEIRLWMWQDDAWEYHV